MWTCTCEGSWLSSKGRANYLRLLPLTWFVGICVRPTSWRWAWCILWRRIIYSLPCRDPCCSLVLHDNFFGPLDLHLLVWNELENELGLFDQWGILECNGHGPSVSYVNRPHGLLMYYSKRIPIIAIPPNYYVWKALTLQSITTIRLSSIIQVGTLCAPPSCNRTREFDLEWLWVELEFHSVLTRGLLLWVIGPLMRGKDFMASTLITPDMVFSATFYLELCNAHNFLCKILPSKHFLLFYIVHTST